MAALMRTVLTRSAPHQFRLFAAQGPANVTICGVTTATLKITNVKNEAEFDNQVVKNSKVVIVDFHAQ